MEVSENGRFNAYRSSYSPCISTKVIFSGEGEEIEFEDHDTGCGATSYVFPEEQCLKTKKGMKETDSFLTVNNGEENYTLHFYEGKLVSAVKSKGLEKDPLPANTDTIDSIAKECDLDPRNIPIPSALRNNFASLYDRNQ